MAFLNEHGERITPMKPEPTLNAMQAARAGMPATIKELNQYLADLEARWTDEDKHFLGEFDEQYLYIDTPQGVAYAYFQYHGEFGLIAFPNQEI